MRFMRCFKVVFPTVCQIFKFAYNVNRLTTFWSFPVSVVTDSTSLKSTQPLHFFFATSTISFLKSLSSVSATSKRFLPMIFCILLMCHNSGIQVICKCIEVSFVKWTFRFTEFCRCLLFEVWFKKCSCFINKSFCINLWAWRIWWNYKTRYERYGGNNDY